MSSLARRFAQLACLFPQIGFAQTFTADDVSSIANSNTIPNIHLREALGARAKTDAPAAVDTQTTALGAGSLAQTFREVSNDFNSRKRTYEIGSYVLKANDELVKKAILGGLTASGEGAALAPIAGAVADIGLGYVEKKFDESAQDDLRRLLKTRLDQVEQQSDAEYQRLIKLKDSNQFLAELKTDTGSLYGTALDQLPQNVQDEVNQFTIKETSKIMEDGFTWVAQTTSLQQNEIDQNGKDISGLAQTFSQFADQMTAQVATLKQQQSDLKDSLVGLQTNVSADNDKLNTVSTFLYAKMSPEERVAAINSGLLDGTLPPDQIAVLKKEADLEQKAQALQTTASQYIDGAANIVQIAHNLGVSDNIVKPAQEVVQAGQDVLGAVKAFASGNFLGGIASITSIFGIGGPDVNEVRFEQILNSLGVIDKKLDVLGEKVDAVLKGEQQILDLQKETYKAIVSVSQQIADSHTQEMKELSTIEGRIATLNDTLLDIATNNFSSCTTLVTPQDINQPIIDTKTKLYPSEATLHQLFVDFSSSFSDCFQHFTNTLRFKPADNRWAFDQTFFALTSYRAPGLLPQDEVTKADQIEAFVEHTYANALNLIRRVPLESLPPQQRIQSLFIPVNAVGVLDSKLLSTLQITNVKGFSADQLLDLVSVPVSVPAVLAHAKAALNIHAYYLFLDAMNQPRPWKELITATDVRQTGNTVLDETRLLIDVTIAQQMLIAGDSLLPVISDVIRNWASPLSDADGLQCYVIDATKMPPACKDKYSPRQLELILAGVKETTRADLYNAAIDLIQSDDVLAENYVRYQLRHDVLAHGSTLSYAVAVEQQDDHMLRSVAGPAWSFQSGDGGKTWKTPIGSAKVQLPSAEDLSAGTLLLPSAVQDLLTARDRVTDELATYGITAASRDELKRINLLWLSAAPSKCAP